jgi:hypothetical protein
MIVTLVNNKEKVRVCARNDTSRLIYVLALTPKIKLFLWTPDMASSQLTILTKFPVRMENSVLRT